ncbi:hypothetical protein D3C75_1216350 [compost metagenome]
MCDFRCVHRLHIHCLQYIIQPADMIRIGMSSDHCVQSFYAQGIKILDYIFALIIIATVNQDVLISGRTN